MAAATRGAEMATAGAVARSAHASSSSPAGKSAAVRFMASSTSAVTTLTTNSPVARTLVSVSLTPDEVKCTTGGWLDRMLE